MSGLSKPTDFVLECSYQQFLNDDRIPVGFGSTIHTTNDAKISAREDWGIVFVERERAKIDEIIYVYFESLERMNFFILNS